MAIKKDYTTKVKLDAFLGITTVEPKATDSINAAIDLVDKTTGRNFVAETASARKFSGNGGLTIRIDECIEVTLVKRGNDNYGDTYTTISAGGTAGYYLLPENYVQRVIPIDHIHLRAYHWIKGFQNNQITAKWGYSEVCPDDVSWATTIIAGGIYNYSSSGGAGVVKSEKIGNYSVSFQDESGWDEYNKALTILNNYKKWSL